MRSMNRPESQDSENFGDARAAELAREAATWDPSSLVVATPDDIPVVDVQPYLATGDPDELNRLGEQVRFIGENIGFQHRVGHGIDTGAFQSIFGSGEGIRDVAVSHLASPARGQPWPHGRRPPPQPC